MAVDAVADMAVEQPLELPERNTGLTRQGHARLWRLDARLHGPRHEEQLLAGDAEPVAEIHALGPEALADMGVQEQVADGSRKLASVIALDDGDHHIERRDAARAGDPVAVDLEQRRHQGDVGKGLAEGRQMLTMEGRPSLIEQTCLGEDIGSAGNAADGDAFARETP